MTRAWKIVAFALLTTTACNKSEQAAGPAGAEASDAKGDSLSAAIDSSSRFGKALAAAGMAKAFDGPATYTILAPTDAAFDKLPAGAEDTLLKPEGKPELTKLLGTHVLSGTILAADLGKAIDQGGGKATLPTLSGQTLTAKKDGDKIVISDSAGGSAVVTGADEQHGNGVIHHVDSVLMPKA